MSSNSVIILSDSHIGPEAEDPTTQALHRFLRQVPKMGRHLIINGDLFEFWFEYRSVVPRTAFPTLAVIAEVVREGVRVTIMGGNHDRWGGPFWKEQLGVEYHARSVELELAGWRALVSHCDGECEPETSSRMMHRLIGHPITSLVFRALHPDFGFWLVKRMPLQLSRRKDRIGGSPSAARAQAAYAAEVLRKRDDLDLVVFGHTHRATIQENGKKRWYLNPGAWMNGYEFAMVTEKGPELCRWEQ